MTEEFSNTSAIIAGANYTHITTATTTVVKPGFGVLERIVINQAKSSSVITIYDNTAASGSVIGIITNPPTLLQNHFKLDYGVVFGTGLTIVTSGEEDNSGETRPSMSSTPSTCVSRASARV